jgi:hypothetical protein
MQFGSPAAGRSPSRAWRWAAIAVVLVALLAIAPAVFAAGKSGGQGGQQVGGGATTDAVGTAMHIECAPRFLKNTKSACFTWVSNNSSSTAPTGKIQETINGGTSEFPGGHQCEIEDFGGKAGCILYFEVHDVGRGTRGLLAEYLGDSGHTKSGLETTIIIVRQATDTMTCTPFNPSLNGTVECNAKVSDDATASPKERPMGTFTFHTAGNAEGEFVTGATCNLTATAGREDTSECSATWRPTSFGNGTVVMQGFQTATDMLRWSGANNAEVTLKPKRTTATTVVCPHEDANDQTIKCLVKVEDTTKVTPTQTEIEKGNPVRPLPPIGQVNFSSSATGIFPGGASCNLAEVSQSPAYSICEVEYLPQTSSPTFHRITATYPDQPGRDSASAITGISISGGAIHYAAPGGTGATPCLERASPCSLVIAARAAKGGDEVVLEPGEYQSSSTEEFGRTEQIVLKEHIRFRGEFGQPRPEIVADPDEAEEFYGPVLVATSDDIVSHISVVEPQDPIEKLVNMRSLLEIKGGVVDQVFVSGRALGGVCSITGSAVLRDSACISKDEKSGPGYAALEIANSNTALQHVDLRNVTAVAELSEAINVVGSEGPATVNAKSTIALSQEGVDIRAFGNGPAGRNTTVELDHSDYATTEALTAANGVTITAPGSGTNITARPKLAGDLVHEEANSPTIDTGDVDGLSGEQDLDGRARALPLGQPDIGASELTAYGSHTALTCPGSVLIGGAAKCTVTVDDTSGSAVTPTGRVVFESSGGGILRSVGGTGSNPYCTLVAVSAGVSSCDIEYQPTKTAGSPHTITARYGVDINHNESEAVASIKVQHASSAALTCNPETVQLSTETDCTVTVKDPSETATPPTGLVRFEAPPYGAESVGFFSNGGRCNLVQTAPDTASCQIGFTPVRLGFGHEQLIGNYAGDEIHGAQQAITEIKIAVEVPLRHATAVGLNCAPGEPELGVPTNCLAVVKDVDSSPSQPTGQLEFENADGLSAGVFSATSCELAPVSGSSDQSSCEVEYTAVAEGTELLFSTYRGDTTHAPSQGETTIFPLVEENPRAKTTTTVDCSPSPLEIGSSATCTASLTGFAAGQNPQGNFGFSTKGAGAFDNASCQLAETGPGAFGCSVQYTPSEVGTKAHRISALYSGDTNNRPSLGSFDLNVRAVQIHDTKTTVDCAFGGTIGQLAQCTAFVEDLAASPIATTGTVEFSTDSPTVGQFNTPTTCELTDVEGGKRGCTVVYEPTALGSGKHRITAKYSGSGESEPSEGFIDLKVQDNADTSVSCNPETVAVNGTTDCLIRVRDPQAVPRTPTGHVGVTIEETREGVFTPNGCDLQAVAGDEAEATCHVTYAPNPKFGGLLTVDALYEGDTFHVIAGGTTRIAAEEEGKDKVQNVVSCSPDDLKVETLTTCTVTVTDVEANPTVPTGRVQWAHSLVGEFENSEACMLVPNEGTASASCSLEYLPEQGGEGEIYAGYVGDPTHNSRVSKTTIEVQGGPSRTVTTIACEPSAKPGQEVPCTATVIDPTRAPVQPFGEVHFSTDSDGSFSNGEACELEVVGSDRSHCQVFYTPGVPLSESGGVHVLTAEFPGDEVSEQEASVGTTTLQVGDPITASIACEVETVLIESSPTCIVEVTDPLGGEFGPNGRAPTGRATLSSDRKGLFEEINGQNAVGQTITCNLKPVSETTSICDAEEIQYTPEVSGLHTLTVSYLGDEYDLPATGTGVLNVLTYPGEHGTATAVGCQPSTGLHLGDSTECSVSVEDTDEVEGSVPAGEVELSTDSTGTFDHTTCQLVPAAEGLSANCDFNYTTGAHGVHNLKAVFVPSDLHQASAGSTAVTVLTAEEEGHEAELAPTKVQLTCNPNEVEVGEATDCRAIVEDTSEKGSLAPFGKVHFESDNGGLFSEDCELKDDGNGHQACQVTFRATKIGLTTVGAHYEGDAIHQQADGSTGLNVVGDPTKTSISCEPTAFDAAESTTCAIEVENEFNEGASAPLGQVNLTATHGGVFSPVSCPLVEDEGGNSSSCTATYSSNINGAHALTATYQPDNAHVESSGNTQVTVTGGVNFTTAAVGCEPNVLDLGQVTHCVVTVEDLDETAPSAPTGKVLFDVDVPNGEFQPAAAECELTGSGNAATCFVDYKNGARGPATLTASYVGDSAHAEATAQTMFTVRSGEEEEEFHAGDGHKTTTALDCAPSTLNVGDASTCTATVTDTAASPTTPSGKVNFGPAGGELSPESCDLTGSGASASCEVTFTPASPGQRDVDAAYAGDETHQASSDTETLTVNTTTGGNPIETTTTLDCAPGTVEVGDASTCTATVTNSSAGATPTGTVTFQPAGSEFSQPTCDLTGSGQAATCTVDFTPASPGIHSLTASYGGDEAHQTSVSGPFELTAETSGGGGEEGVITTTSLSCAPAKVFVGKDSTCTATVTNAGEGGTPDGVVSFKPAGPELSATSCELVGTGASAGCEVTFTPATAGPHDLTASYAGSATHQASESAAFTVIGSVEGTGGEGDATKTTVTCQSPVAEGTASNCKVKVEDEAATPAGELNGQTVSFSSSGTGSFDNATCTLVGNASSGECAVNYTAAAPGTDTITAKFAADTDHQASQDSASVETTEGGTGGNGHATSTALDCAPSTLNVGDASTCTATVTDTAASPTTPSGKVNFGPAGGELSPESCDLTGSGASASCEVTFTPASPGQRDVDAAYAGDETHQASSDTETLTVNTTTGGNPIETTTTLDCAPGTVEVGDASTCTATVTNSSAGATPTGTVTFQPAGSEFSQPTCDLTGSGQAATCTVDFTPASPGIHSLTASYGGDEAHQTSVSGPFELTATTEGTGGEGIETQTTLDCVPNPVAVGSGSDCTATVTNQASGQTPTGEVTFTPTSGELSETTCDLSGTGESASCQVTFTPASPGDHQLTAGYLGDEGHQVSASAPFTLTATTGGGGGNEDATKTTLTCDSPVAEGTASNCKVKVEDEAATPAGELNGQTVSFSSSDAAGIFNPVAATCTLTGNASSGECAVDYTAVAPGTDTITAKFAADTDHQASQDSASVETTSGGGGNLHATETTVTCNPTVLTLRGTGNTAACTVDVKDNGTPVTTPTGKVKLTSSNTVGSLSATECTLDAAGSCGFSYETKDRNPATLTSAYQGDEGHRVSSGTEQITVLPAAQEEAGWDDTATTLACQPTLLNLNGKFDTTDCTVTVEDTTAQTPPTGKVMLKSSNPGVFLGGTECDLTASGAESAGCEFSYRTTNRANSRLTGSYQGDVGFKVSSDNELITVRTEKGEEEFNEGLKHDTATTLACQPTLLNLTAAPSKTTCTVDVKDNAAPGITPTGKVKLTSSNTVGSLSEAECTLDAAGSCEFSYETKDRNPTTLTAAYQGDEGHRVSADSKEVKVRTKVEEEAYEEELKDDTATTLACQPALLNLNGELNTTKCTVDVEDTKAPGSTPTGKVKITSSNPVGSLSEAECTLNAAGSCGFSYETKDRNPATLTAAYQGDEGRQSSSDNKQIQVRTEKGEEEFNEGLKHDTATTLACQPTLLSIGGKTTCTVDVKDNGTPVTTPTGKVKLTSSNTVGILSEAECTLNAAGSCEFSYEAKDRVETDLKATYQGDEGHKGSVDSKQITVRTPEEEELLKDTTKTTLTCDSPVAEGTASNCKVKVEDEAATPAGELNGQTVSFSSSDAAGIFNPVAATCTLTGNASSGECAVDYTAVAPGTDTITAKFAADTDHQASQDSASVETTSGGGGNLHATETTVTCNPTELATSAPTDCTATVIDKAAAGATTPSGKVDFDSDKAGAFSNAGTCVLTESTLGTATCKVTFRPTAVGTHTVSASYRGDASHEAGSGTTSIVASLETPPLSETKTTLDCAPGNVEAGSASTCTATVEDIATSPTLPQGTVEFASDNAGVFSAAAACDLVQTGPTAAACAVDYTPTVAGKHKISATYEDAQHRLSQGRTSITANKDESNRDLTETGLSCAKDTVANGEGVICTVEVTDTSSTPTGTVRFDTHAIGDFNPTTCDLQNGKCEVTYTPQQVGTHKLFATYEGDPTHMTSQGTAKLTVEQGTGGNGDATETTVTCNPTELATSAPTDCTATVVDKAAEGATTPSGKVEFGSDKAGVFANAATCELTETQVGSASCDVTFRPTVEGTHTINADYRGDSGHEVSSGTTPIVATLEVPTLSETKTTLVCDPNSLVAGEDSTCTATVEDASASPTQPAGTVEFASNNAGVFSQAAGCALAPAGANSASCEVVYTPVVTGTHKVFATYEGVDHRISQGTATITASAEVPPRNPSATALNCAKANVATGEGVTCTVEVTDTATENQSQPTGEVHFDTLANGVFAPAECELQNGKCEVTYTAAQVGKGTHTLFATYQGDSAHTKSQGIALLTVEQGTGGNEGDDTETTVTCNPTELATSAPTDCTATVVDKAANGATTASGKVDFDSDKRGVFSNVGTCVLTESTVGTATCDVSFRPTEVGTHTIKASYRGDASHKAGSGTTSIVASLEEPPLSETITTLDCVPASLEAGKNSTCTATVEDIETPATLPQGSVEFASDNAGVFSEAAACELEETGPATAACSVEYTPVVAGEHKVAATYEDAKQRISQGRTVVTATDEATPHNLSETAFSCAKEKVATGEGVSCTVTVKDIAAANQSEPTGTVSFGTHAHGKFAPTTCELQSGKCEVIYTPELIGKGVHKLYATYEGDDAHTKSQGIAEVKVFNPTKTEVSCDAVELASGAKTNCTLKVTDTNPTLEGNRTPTGTVTFKTDNQGGFTPGGCELTFLDGAAATCTFSYEPSVPGVHNLTTEYTGDESHVGSNGQLTLNVVDPTATALSCTPISVILGENPGNSVCTVKVTDTAAKPATPGGTVNFKSDGEGTFTAPSCQLGGDGSCQVTYHPTGAVNGNHKVTASYAGTATHKPSEASAQIAVALIDTKIVRKPKLRTPQKVAVFAFTSNVAVATFECKLDKLKWGACKKPFNTKTLRKKKVGRKGHKRIKYVFKLRNGKHVFQVRAVANGVVDTTPAVYKWTVGKKVKKHRKHAKKHKAKAHK